MSFSPPQESPNLPSLAAALADTSGATQTIQIAPELIGDGGAPPDLPRREELQGQQPSDGVSQAFGSYQSSSTRDDGYRGWSNGPNPPPRPQNPWEEGYRDHPSHPDQIGRAHV